MAYFGLFDWFFVDERVLPEEGVPKNYMFAPIFGIHAYFITIVIAILNGKDQSDVQTCPN